MSAARRASPDGRLEPAERPASGAEGSPESRAAYPPIGDYAIIGDCRSAALVSRGGSLDWLCVPRFDAPALFCALLDERRGGRFAVRPGGRFESRRRYVGDTNVLETTFSASDGALRLVDAMPVASEREKRGELRPDQEVLRRVECLAGEVEVEVVYEPRPGFGVVPPRLVRRGALGWACEHARAALHLRTDLPLVPSDAGGLEGKVVLQQGERRFLSMIHTTGEPAVLPPLGGHAEQRLETTLAWWRDWAGRCRYEGPHRPAIVRSALALKLLAYAPSGAVVAAPTTSLPESPGGARNWDYRYCWLRDASLTLQALLDLGYDAEAQAFLDWLFHSTRLTWPELQVLYDVHGETRLPERTLEHLEGYAGSRPVRVGNAARHQLQLDVYGEVVDAALEFVRRGGRLARATCRLLTGFGKTVCKRWREPDEGIWEPRSGRRHHTYSKVMCWVALDRLLTLHEKEHVSVPAEAFARERDAIRAAIEERAWNESLGSYVDELDGDQVDASLLLLPHYGFVEASSPRMRATFERVHERLARNGLLYRYLGRDDGLPGAEGAFGVASFWSVDCRCRLGQVEEAGLEFERLLGHANDVGLFAEEIDPETGAALGNFPQAFTHVGLIDAALTLADCGQARPGRPTRGEVPMGRGTGRREDAA